MDEPCRARWFRSTWAETCRANISLLNCLTSHGLHSLSMQMDPSWKKLFVLIYHQMAPHNLKPYIFPHFHAKSFFFFWSQRYPFLRRSIIPSIFYWQLRKPSTITDQCQYLSICAPTPPLPQQQSTDKKLGLCLVRRGVDVQLLRHWHWFKITSIVTDIGLESSQAWRGVLKGLWAFKLQINILIKTNLSVLITAEVPQPCLRLMFQFRQL